MVDTAGETVPCQYCGAEVEVPADCTRFEAFTAHFETEHVDARMVSAEADPAEGSRVAERAAGEESGVGDD